jgi:hypothetical protein
MGILLNGILGSMTGKVSGVVGSKWKGRNTLRAYAKPSNPNTAAQQTQRGLFSFCVATARLVLGTVIADYWDPFQSSISGFNAFVKKSLLAVTSESDYANIVMSDGSLEGAAITGSQYVTGVVNVEWNSGISGNGLSTDFAVGVVIDSANNIAYVDDTGVARADVLSEVNVGLGRTAADLKAYLFFYRGSGSSLIVSPSSYAQVTT